MSNNERIRLVRLSKSLEKHALLSRLSLVVYDGEALGGFGFSAYEKDALRRILLGKYAYDGGCIFWDEKLSRDNPLLPGRYIAWIGGNTSLIEDASVAENLFVFKAGRNFFSIVNWGSVLKQAQINLDDMGLSISARTPVSKLNCLEHRIVEIIRASLQGARLIVIDETIGALGENAYGILGDVLKRLKQRGISFLIFDAHISTLEQLTDRLVIQSHGCVLNFSRDSFRHGMAIQEQMIDAAIKSRSSLAEREIVFRADRLPIDLGHCVSFDLHKGEMIEIYDAGRGFNDMLIKKLINPSKQAGTLRILEGNYPSIITKKYKKIVFSDLNADNCLEESLTPLENLCLPIYPRLSRNMVLSKRSMCYIRRQFTAWFGCDAIFNQPDCSKLSPVEKAAIMLFRFQLQGTRILFCTDPRLCKDYPTYLYIVKSLRSLADTYGMAVCFFTAVAYEKDTLCDLHIDFSSILITT